MTTTHMQQLQELVIQKLQIEGLPPSTQEEIVSEVGGLIMGNIMAGLAEVVPQEKQGEYATLLEGGDIDGLYTFIEKHIPEHEELVQNEIETVLREVSL